MTEKEFKAIVERQRKVDQFPRVCYDETMDRNYGYRDRRDLLEVLERCGKVIKYYVEAFPSADDCGCKECYMSEVEAKSILAEIGMGEGKEE